MVLKVVFPSESFIDSFIGLWNNSPRHHTDSLHTIKPKRFASVFPAEEDTVGQGSVAVREGGHLRGGQMRGGQMRGCGRGGNMQLFH